MSVTKDGYLDSGFAKRALLDSIEIMGDRGRAAFVEDLQLRGLDLDDKKLSLSEIALTMRSMFGDEITDIVMQRVMIRLDEMCSVPVQRSGRQSSP